jgi:hypothetical protein
MKSLWFHLAADALCSHVTIHCKVFIELFAHQNLSASYPELCIELHRVPLPVHLSSCFSGNHVMW